MCAHTERNRTKRNDTRDASKLLGLSLCTSVVAVRVYAVSICMCFSPPVHECVAVQKESKAPPSIVYDVAEINSVNKVPS